MNTRLPGDLNLFLSSNTYISSAITEPTDNTLPYQKQEVNIGGIKYRFINALYCYSRNITKIRGLLIEESMGDYYGII